MAIKSVSVAAKELGYKTRSSLQNLMRDGLLDEWVRFDSKGRRCLEMEGLAERLRQVVRFRPDNVIAKSTPEPYNAHAVLQVGDSCNALCEQFGWATRHTAAEWDLIAKAIDQARKEFLSSPSVS